MARKRGAATKTLGDRRYYVYKYFNENSFFNSIKAGVRTLSQMCIAIVSALEVLKTPTVNFW